MDAIHISVTKLGSYSLAQRLQYLLKHSLYSLAQSLQNLLKYSLKCLQIKGAFASPISC